MCHFMILLATYNGEPFLNQQIKSIKDQTVDHISILVSDDGSTDATIEILKEWQKNWVKGDFQIIEGPQKGFEENFRSLIAHAELTCDFFAFSDQDDIWLPHKLKDAFKCVSLHNPDIPTMICGRTQLINKKGETVGYSPEMRAAPSFKNALVQSIAGANTMVFNGKTLKLLKAVSLHASFVSHDWWTYLWVTGAGGTVIYDATPKILYRQHEANIIGSNNGIYARIIRIRKIFDGVFRRWTDQNLSGLSLNDQFLIQENKALVKKMTQLRQGNPLWFLMFLLQKKIRRQTYFGNLSLLAAALFKKI